MDLLLNNGANVEALGGRYGTALQAALIRGDTEIVELLQNINFDDGGSIASVESVQESVFSSTGTDSSHSSTDPSYAGGLDLFISLALRDEELSSLLSSAVKRTQRTRFVRNHRRLLESFYLDLLGKAQDIRQKQVIRLFQTRSSRDFISSRIYGGLTTSKGLEELQSRALGQENVDMVARMLQGSSPNPLHDDSTQVPNNQSAVNFQSAIGVNSAQSKNEPDSSSGDDEDSSSEGGNEDAAEISIPHRNQLHAVEHFVFQTGAFKQYKARVRRFVYPPSPRILQQLVADRNIDLVQTVLDEDFELVACGQFYWLRDVVDVGYSTYELAELLVDVEAGNPWLYFEPSYQEKYSIYAELHQEQCAHSAVFCLEQGALPRSDDRPWCRGLNHITPEKRDEIKNKVFELCGLAGVIPLSRTESEWDGRVAFDESDDFTTALVTYAPHASDQELLLRLQRIGGHIYATFGLLQYHGICCNSFTILTGPLGENPDRLLELCRIEAKSMISLLGILDQIQGTDGAQLSHLYHAARAIICEITADRRLSDQGASHDCKEIFHEVSLVLQILSLGLVSYIHGHAGALRPFFLARAIHKLVLLGTSSLTYRAETARIHRLVRISNILPA